MSSCAGDNDQESFKTGRPRSLGSIFPHPAQEN